MHRRLKKLLHDARGESRFVVVVFLDVRGFSSWMKDPSQAAVFLKSVYTQIVDDYFGDASFFKPTGDGLLVVVDHDGQNLAQVVQQVVRESIRLVETFETLTQGDPMVNFPVPRDLGIGIARGSATRLVSGRQTLDYSGHPLNLAARLMDLARPSGVVFDETLDVGLLEGGLQERFRPESVYIKGLAEGDPMTVHVLADRVVVPEFNRFPINRHEHHMEASETVPLRELASRDLFEYRLTYEPANKDAIAVHISYPSTTKSGRRRPGMYRTKTLYARYGSRTGEHLAFLDFAPISADLKQRGVRPGWTVTVTIEYPVRVGTRTAG